MPLLLIGLIAGAGGTYWLSDKAEKVINIALIGTAAFILYQLAQKARA